jgi:pyridoxal phosphate enzyme (YggS family)
MDNTYEILLKNIQKHSASLVAVSKTKPPESILWLYDQGQRAFGENKAQEMADKHALLPKDIEWHFIGHLQTNKVKLIAPFVSLVHSLDSPRLLVEMDRQAAKHRRIINGLLQFKIAEEDSKFGSDTATMFDFLGTPEFAGLRHLNIVGVMGMATFTEDEAQIRREFSELANIFKTLHEGAFKGKTDFKIISMGMSGDYEIALEAGSNMLRIGSLLFGAR